MQLNLNKNILNTCRISFEDKQIKILESSPLNRTLYILNAVLWILYGFAAIYIYLITKNIIILWSGILLGTVFSYCLIRKMTDSNVEKIHKNQILSMEIKNIGNQKYLYINLKNNCIKRFEETDCNFDKLKPFL